jgi:hypothetical protein
MNKPIPGYHPDGSPMERAKDRKLTIVQCELVPCKPYKVGKKSRRIRKNRWQPIER